MGRPREHDRGTRAALLTAAERLVETAGPDALAVRAVAAEAATTTRAVYSLFGSKDGLVAALAEQAFLLLRAGIEELPVTNDPAGDLVKVGAQVFRRFVVEHPSLYRIAFQRIAGLTPTVELTEVRRTVLAGLEGRVRRAKDAGAIGRASVREATIGFNALCEGLANAELRGRTLPIFPEGQEERAWNEALRTLIRGFGASLPSRRR
jgi:AcrR family transcriptional regulator